MLHRIIEFTGIDAHFGQADASLCLGLSNFYIPSAHLNDEISLQSLSEFLTAFSGTERAKLLWELILKSNDYRAVYFVMVGASCALKVNFFDEIYLFLDFFKFRKVPFRLYLRTKCREHVLQTELSSCVTGLTSQSC